MKRMFCLLLAAALLAPCAALAASAGTALEYAKNYLTEVCGYTAEDADAFVFEAEETPDAAVVTFYNHPGWEYTLTLNADGSWSTASPFPCPAGYIAYPGESSVRQGLYAAREGGWFARWEDAAVRAEMAAWLERWGVSPTPALAAGLADGGITGAQALKEYFRSCYGPEAFWTDALREWCAQESDSHGLAPAPAAMEQAADRAYTAGSMQVTEFTGEAPAEVAAAFSDPNLAGWELTGGACAQRESGMGTGLAVFARGEERLLCALWREADAAGWIVLPVGDRALLSGREVIVRYGGSGAFDLIYPIAEGESERFSVSPHTVFASDAVTLRCCLLNGYVYENERTGAYVQIDGESEDGAAAFQWFRVLSRAAAGEALAVTQVPVLLPRFLDFWEADAFPRTEAEVRAMQGGALPDGFGVVSGVRLRKRTSTRSAILGDYFGGVPVEVLEELPGDPYPWYRVRIGSAEGYMASIYVDYPGSVCESKPLQDDRSLPPMAVCAADTALRAGTGWFDRTVQDLPAGTRLRVLAEQGDWLHVTVADGPMGWLALTDGLVDGYVKASDVRIAATEAQLDWLE